MSTYGAGPTKHTRATRDEMAGRREGLYEIVRDEQPTGVRFTYYRAVSKGLVPKTDSGYRKVQRLLMEMRESGEIPYKWIVDSSRWMRKPESWSSVEQMLLDAGASYRKALWHQSDVKVEVWCESESVAGVIGPVTMAWDVPLYPIKGQTSASFAYGAAQEIKYDDRKTVIYYLGDRDPAGREIELHLIEKLRRYSGRTDFEFLRLAATDQQVEDLHLLGSAPKKSTISNPITGMRETWSGLAVEVEAIDPPYLRELVESSIIGHLDLEALRLHQIAEQSERAWLQQTARLAPA